MINDTLALYALDGDSLLAELTEAAEREGHGPRVVSFALLPADEQVVEAAVEVAIERLEGLNRRGRALALICEEYLKAETNG